MFTRADLSELSLVPGVAACHEDTLECNQVARAVVVVQDRENNFQLHVCDLGEVLLEALRYRVGALAKRAAAPGRQHEVGAPLHDSCGEKPAYEPLSIRP